MKRNMVNGNAEGIRMEKLYKKLSRKPTDRASINEPVKLDRKKADNDKPDVQCVQYGRSSHVEVKPMDVRSEMAITISMDTQNAINAKKHKLLLHPTSNHFDDPVLEKQYQDYCSVLSFKRARIVSYIGLVVHIILSVVFGLLEGDHANGLDLLPRDYSQVGEWLQWAYAPIPFLFFVWPVESHVFRKHWKRWLSLMIVLFVLGVQVWLTYQATHSEEDFEAKVKEKILCADNDREIDSKFVGYVGSMQVSQFIIERNANLHKAFVGIASTLLTVVGSTIAVAVRLDFLHVVCVCLFTAFSLVTVMGIYGVKHQAPLVFVYCLPGLLLIISCYHADRNARKTFVAKLAAENENKMLEAALHEAEEALRNDSAKASEKDAVANGLLLNDLSKTGDRRKALLENIRIPFDDIKLLRMVGKGGMGEVIQAEYLGIQVVCKRIAREHINVKTMKNFRMEIELMSCLRHPNIVLFIGASWDNCSNVCMVMEYMEKGDVYSVLHSKMGSGFTWFDPLLKIAIDAGQGMLYLHGQDPPVVHRDLKSVNLLCSATYGCKVSDFGLSKRYHNVDALMTVVGTPYWLCPEIIRNERYGTKADVYSFGIVLTELETRKTPYHDCEDTGLKVMMRVANDGLRPTLPSSCLPHRRQLIESCLADNPKDRPTFAEILIALQGSVRDELLGADTQLVMARRALLQRQQNLSVTLEVQDEDST